jgi:glycosyltransferase involved in cell wall biosynthesis
VTFNLNVLILGQYFPPDLGGAATRAYNVARGLVLNGCNVTVVTAFPHYPHGNIPREYKFKPFKEEKVGNIRVIRTAVLPLESKGMFRRIFLFFSFAFSSLMVLPKVRKIDVIWAANPDVFVLFPAIMFGLVKRRPVTCNVDDLVIEDLYDLKLVNSGSIVSKILELFARFVYRRMKAVTPISPGYCATIKKYGVNQKNIHVIGGGVDLSVFEQGKVAANGKSFSVLYSGAFSIAYDFEQILNAAKIIEETNQDVTFILQGKGELAEEIRSKISELNLKNVRLIEKILSRKEVAEFLNEADVLILPLRDFGKPYLGISSKLYEFQAAGKPILCCAEGQPSEYVRDTKSGIVLKPGDYAGLAKAILFLRDNPNLAKDFGVAGRSYVEENLTIEKIGLHIKEIFEHQMLCVL